MRFNGSIRIDDGAVRALHNGKSLLAAGIIEAFGEFDRGDVVAIEDAQGRMIAKGMIEYDVEDCDRIKGLFGRVFDSNFTMSDDGSASDIARFISIRSSHSLKGAYLGMMKVQSTRSVEDSEQAVPPGTEDFDDEVVETELNNTFHQEQSALTQRVLEDLISSNQTESEICSLFMSIDTDGNGELDLEEFIAAYGKLNKDVSRATIVALFEEGMYV